MGECAAIPRDLIEYALWGKRADAQLAVRARALGAALDALRRSRPDPKYLGSVPALDLRVAGYTATATAVDDRVGRVGEAFREAGQAQRSLLAPHVIGPGGDVLTALVVASSERIDALARSAEGLLVADERAPAYASAQSLRDAMTGGAPRAGRRRIERVLRDLEEHRYDPVYLRAFFSVAGPQLAGLAAVLSRWNGTGGAILTAADRRMLGGFGRSLAAAARERLLTVPATIDAFTGAPSLWSAAMIFRCAGGQSFGTGPHDQGTELLAAMGRTVLRHLDDGSLSPPVASLPAGSALADHYRAQRQLAELDGATAVLSAAARDPAAASLVLGGPGGAGLARALCSSPWEIPGYSFMQSGGGRAAWLDPPIFSVPGIDVSRAAADFITAATSAPRGAGDTARLAAQAVVNIAAGLPPAVGTAARLVPRTMRSALLGMMNRYRYDLGLAALYPSRGSEATRLQNGTWIADLSLDPLQTLVTQAVSDPASYGRFLAVTIGSVAKVAAWTALNRMSPRGVELLREQAALTGIVQLAENHLGFDRGMREDAVNAARQEVAAMAQNGFWAVIGVIVPEAEIAHATELAIVETGLEAADAISEPVVQSMFKTDNAILALVRGQDAFHRLSERIWSPIVQALVESGAAHPPKGMAWNVWLADHPRYQRLIEIARTAMDQQGI